MTKVRFSKKTKADYDALATKEAGKVYFVGNPSDTSEVGQIYVDGKKYGGGLTEEEQAYIDEQLEAKKNARLSVAITASPSGIIAYGLTTTVVYTLTSKWDGTLADLSSAPSGWTRKSTGTYTKTVSVTNASVTSGSASCTLNGVTKTAGAVTQKVYDRIVYGSGSASSLPSNLSTVAFTEESDGTAVQTNPASGYSLKKYAVKDTVANFDNVTFVAHTDTKFLILVPTAVSGKTTAVTGSTYNSITMTGESALQTVKFVKSSTQGVSGYTVFESETVQTAGATYTLSNK